MWTRKLVDFYIDCLVSFPRASPPRRRRRRARLPNIHQETPLCCVACRYLAADLGVPPAQIPVWSGDNYDSVYILTFDAGKALTNFTVSAENFTATPQVAARAVTAATPAGDAGARFSRGRGGIGGRARKPVDPKDWFACRPGSGPCNPKPKWAPTYNMRESTSMQVCNFSGYQDPATTRKWGLVDWDWENARGDQAPGGGWSWAKPMDCGDRMLRQVEMQLNAYPETKSKFMMYRNFVKALPWLEVVRSKLSNPAYSPWFLNFSAAVQANHSLSHVPVCDSSNAGAPLCTYLYHDQILTPRSAQCGGDPAHCDCGASTPCGEYLFDFRSANVSVNGQTMVDWFVDEYMLGPTGAGHPAIVGCVARGWGLVCAGSNARACDFIFVHCMFFFLVGGDGSDGLHMCP